MANKQPNIDGLRAYSSNKTKVSINKVNIAIKELVKNQEKINFNSVSNLSGVSKAFLYKNDELKSRIEYLRKQQEELPSPN